jgi:hypothetical protein
MVLKRSLLALLIAVALGAVSLATLDAGPAAAAAVKKCKPVKHPFKGTRYGDVDITHIRARGVSCNAARWLAKHAENKALGITPPPSGYRRFSYHGWSVFGNLRPAHDRYLATKDGKRVRWQF